MRMKQILRGEDIVKYYGSGEKRQQVLNGVSVAVFEGEFVAVMGPSGSGKSTLLYALSGMDQIDEGEVQFDGIELSNASENELADLRRTKMGFVFQQPTMLKNLNILDNIVLPAMRDRRKNVTNITYRAKTLMDKAGIAGLEMRSITEVSGGQLQRAGICRALINNPTIVFGDEPTGALNSKSAEQMMELFSNINDEGTAVMLVTHDAKIAAWAERVLFMRDGEIVTELKMGKLSGAELELRVEKIAEKMLEVGI